MSENITFEECSVFLADCIFVEGKSYTLLVSDIISLSFLKKPKIIKVYRINNVIDCNKIKNNELYSLYHFSIQGNKYVTIALANGKQTEIMDAEIETIQIKERCFRKNGINMLYTENKYIMNQISVNVCKNTTISASQYKGKRLPSFLLTSLG